MVGELLQAQGRTGDGSGAAGPARLSYPVIIASMTSCGEEGSSIARADRADSLRCTEAATFSCTQLKVKRWHTSSTQERSVTP